MSVLDRLEALLAEYERAENDMRTVSVLLLAGGAWLAFGLARWVRMVLP